MQPSELATHYGVWLRSLGPESDVVLSTRIRLARNVEGYAFPSRIDPTLRAGLETKLEHWIRESLSDKVEYWNLERLSALERQVLMERHLVSRELVQGSGDRGVTIAPESLVSIMSNEEDHLRIQVIRSGQALEEALSAAIAIDQKLETKIPYAFSDRFGFLTACPTNVGTGLRISVMLHLPALVLTDQMDKVFRAAAKVGLTVRGFYGEGTKAVGDVIQVSNQQTLGRTEHEILATLKNIIPKVVEQERGVRTHLLDENRVKVEDKVWRSVGMLRYARRITSDETMNLLSAVRLGVNLKLLPNINVGEVNELFVLTQPGHLQALRGRELQPDDRDIARASLLRERFKPGSN